MIAASAIFSSQSRQLLSAKIIPALLGALVVRRLGLAVLHQPHNLIFWLALISEAVCLVATLFSYRATAESMTLKSASLAYIPSYFFLVVQLCHGEQLVPTPIAGAIVASGFALQLYAKLKLGRRFGILPANRGLMTKGPYAVVRHPIYLGYLIAHCGFLLADFNLWNLGMLAIVHTLLAFRAAEEEKVLRRDPAYRAYAAEVRHRLIPRIF